MDYTVDDTVGDTVSDTVDHTVQYCRLTRYNTVLVATLSVPGYEMWPNSSYT